MVGTAIAQRFDMIAAGHLEPALNMGLPELEREA
jgi:hypothetical protein